MSAWNGIDRGAFDRNLVALYKAGKFQDAQRLPALSPRMAHGADSPRYTLSADVESQMAEDCAFLASWTTWPRHVAASAVHPSFGSANLCISLSANQGIEECVKALFKALLRILERRASREITRQDTERLCFELITPLHRDRILGRLGSEKTNGQKRSQIRLLERVQAISQRLASGIPVNEEDAQQLPKRFYTLERCISTLDNSIPYSDEEYVQLRDVLRAAYDVTEAGDSLVTRLQKAGCHSVSKQSREMREIAVLGNYYRICRSLARVAGRCKDLFSSVKLNVIEPSQPQKGQDLTKYVHAEIQILTHFELHPTPRPRYIAASKKPCFLCYCFIRAHGVYGIGKSHGEVFSQWTVPDDVVLSPQSRGRLCLALLQTGNDIKTAVRQARSRHRVALHPPLQTVSKLQLYTLSSLMTSTQTTAASGHISSRSDIERDPVSTELQLGAARPPKTCTSPVDIAQMVPCMSPAESDSTNNYQSHDDVATFDRIITICNPAIFHGAGLQVYITSEGFGEDRNMTQSRLENHNSESPGVRCRIQQVRNIKSNTTQRVDVTDLPIGEIITIKKANSKSLRFTIVGPLSHFLVDLVWHGHASDE